MTNKETRISSIAIITGFGLWFALIIYSSCEREQPKTQKKYFYEKKSTK